MTKKISYNQILNSSFIMGSAAGINLLLGMIRVKFVSVLIGTTGVGLQTSLTTIQVLVGTLFGLGIQTSAVREVAAAVSKQDDQAIGAAVLVLRRICWLTGLAGMAAMIIFSPLLSKLSFGTSEYTFDIAVLGLVVLFGNLSGGQMALIQGMRRIGDMARANIIGAVFATVAAIGFYSLLGLRGIVPALVSIAAMQLAISWFFARRVPVPPVTLTWRETWKGAGVMVRMGLLFMWTMLLGNGVAYFTATLVSQKIGLQAVGLYSAAFNLSGIFVNIVLNAMGADYYPRLTGVVDDKVALNRMVNEQSEIGLLLAVPGLLATMVLAPWIINLFYTAEFLPATELLQWYVLGCLGRVIAWPLGYVLPAMGKSRWYLITESSFHFIHVMLIAIGLFIFDIQGLAIAFFVMYMFYGIAVYFVVRHLVGFRWSQDFKKIVFLVIPIFVITLVVLRWLSLWTGSIVGGVLVIGVSFFCLRELIPKIGRDHRLVKFISKIPGSRFMFCLP